MNYPGNWPDALDLMFKDRHQAIIDTRIQARLSEPPVSLHMASGQRIVKNLAWELIECLSNSFASLESFSDGHGVYLQRRAMLEAWRSFITLLIFAGLSPSQLSVEPYPERDLTDDSLLIETYWYAVNMVGRATSFLRQNDTLPTDEARFRASLFQAFQWHLKLWAVNGLGPEEMFIIYFTGHEE